MNCAAHILVVRQRVARLQLDDLIAVRRAADVLDAQQVELLLDADVANDVHLRSPGTAQEAY